MGFSSIARPPSHLSKHGHLFYFRYAIPKDLRSVIGLSEIRKSLQTALLSEARPRARKLCVVVQDFLKALRKGEFMALSLAEIQSLLKKFIQDKLEQDEQDKSMASPGDRPFPFERDVEGFAFPFNTFDQEPLSEACRQYEQDFLRFDYSKVEPHICELISQEGLDIEHGSQEFYRLCREYLKAHNTIFYILKQRLNGDFSSEDEALAQALPLAGDSQNRQQEKPQAQPKTPQVSQEQSRAETGTILQELIAAYYREKELAESWKKGRTKEEYESAFNLLTEYFGKDFPIGNWTKSDFQNFKAMLLRLPLHRTKRFPGKSLAEVLEMEHTQTISATRINNILRRIGSLLRWGEDNGYSVKNFASGMKIAQKKRATNRKPFEPDDIRKLFLDKEYIYGLSGPAHFWVPLLALFHGMRIEEICQLHVEDVRQEKGVWILDLFEKEGRGSRKTEASERLVPIHPFLLDSLNFLDYVDLTGKDGKQLFPELRPDKNGDFSPNVSKWFGRYRKRKEVTDPKKVFHSFRNTVANHLKQQGIRQEYVAALLGQTVGGIAFDTYSQDYGPDILLRETVSRIVYSVDLTALKESRYVPK